jgi:methylated-DNA-[protein]-cysteine S-methyltransferase
MTVHFDLFQDALGFAAAFVQDGRLAWLGHCPSREKAEERIEEARLRHWPEAVPDPNAAPLSALRRQLDEYLAGRRRAFDLPLQLAGTEFQQLCWQELQRIPYGETRTYGEMARRIGRPAAVRAVGRANHDNPIGVIVPCHRVIGADGTLTGYAGGLDMKRTLLELEGALSLALPGTLSLRTL